MGAIGKLVSFNSKPNINTTVNVSFVIHGFGVSENGQIISEEVCRDNMNSLINKPVLVDYHYTGDNLTDSFGDHAVDIIKNRDTGEDMVHTKTIAIGVFTDVDIVEIDGAKMLVGHATLWSDRYYNCVSLLYEMLSEGVEVKCSCEYIFMNFSMKDGIQLVNSPITYEGHCILNSVEDRGVGIVEPAYGESRVISFNTAIMTDIKNSLNNKQENLEGGVVVSKIGEEPIVEPVVEPTTEPVVSVNEEDGESVEPTTEPIEEPVEEDVDTEETKEETEETTEDDTEDEAEPTLSTNDKSLIDKVTDKVSTLKKTLEEKLAKPSAWVSTWNIYGNYFVYEAYDNDASEYKYYKVDFGYDEVGELVLSEEHKEVVREDMWIEVAQYQTSLNEIETLKGEKVELSETVVSLNGKIKELEPYKEKAEEDEIKDKVDCAMNCYKEKFSSVNAIDCFEKEEVQKLIVDTISSDANVSLNARVDLSEMLLGLIPQKEVTETPKEEASVKELCNKKVGNLIPTKTKFSDYGLNL